MQNWQEDTLWLYKTIREILTGQRKKGGGSEAVERKKKVYQEKLKVQNEGNNREEMRYLKK